MGFWNHLFLIARKKKWKIFLEKMSPNPSQFVLDLGAEDGKYFEQRYSYKDKIVALDVIIADKHLLPIQKEYPQVKLIQGDGRRLPFKDNSFDMVFCYGVIELQL